MTRIVWSSKSLRDLDRIRAYVAQFNATASIRLVQKIIRRTERLTSFPSSGGFVDEDELRRYRQVLQGNYRVVYRYNEVSNEVTIVTVIHAARLLDSNTLGNS